MLLWPHKSFTLPAQPSLMRIGLVVKIVGDPSLGIVFILEHILYPGLPRSSLLSLARVQRLNTGLFSLVILAASLSIHGYLLNQYWTLTACWILIILSIPLLDVGCTSKVFGCTAYRPRQLLKRCSPPNPMLLSESPSFSYFSPYPVRESRLEENVFSSVNICNQIIGCILLFDTHW